MADTPSDESSGEPPHKKQKRGKMNLSDERIILVGKEKKKYTVNASILSKNSNFFRTAVKNCWSENATISLPEHTSTTFEIWLEYAYSGDIWVLSPEETAICLDEQTTDKEEQHRLARQALNSLVDAYILSNFLDDVSTANAIIDMILDLSRKTDFVLNNNHAQQICENLPTSSTLFLLARDQVMSLGDAAFEKSRSGMPSMILEEFAKETRRLFDLGKTFKLPDDAPQCKYHEHNDEVPRCSGS